MQEELKTTLAEIGDRLIKARIDSGISQNKLAKKLGIRQEYVSLCERNHWRRTSLRRLIEVAIALSEED